MGAVQARLSLQTLHLSKYHIVGNHMSRLSYDFVQAPEIFICVGEHFQEFS